MDKLHRLKGLLIEATSALSVFIACVTMLVVEYYGVREIIRLLQER